MTHAAPDPEPTPVSHDPDGVYDVDAHGGIDDEPAGEPDRTKEPVAGNSVVQLVIAALVTSGWFLADSPWIPIVATAIGLALSVATLLHTRSKVTPL